MSKNIVRVNKSDNYTVMSNMHLRDKALSWKAKGIHSYVLSLPDDWKIILEHLKTISIDGRDSTRSGIQELYDLRYWQRYPVYVDGKIDKWVTEIYEEPFKQDEKIKSIVFRNDVETINYEIYDKNLLTGNPSVVENTDVDLLTGNLQVGNLEVGNPELLNTNNTKYLSFTNHSFNHSSNKNKKENDRLSEDKDADENKKRREISEEEIDIKIIEYGSNQDQIPTKTDIDEFKLILEKSQYDKVEEDYIGISEQAIRILYYSSEPLLINGMRVPQRQIREDLKRLRWKHIDMAIRDFKNASEREMIRNVSAYLSRCIYNSIFNCDAKLESELRYNGTI